MPAFSELEGVSVLIDMPHLNLKAGKVGTIVMAFTRPHEAYEIEFYDPVEPTYFLANLLPTDIKQAP